MWNWNRFSGKIELRHGNMLCMDADGIHDLYKHWVYYKRLTNQAQNMRFSSIIFKSNSFTLFLLFVSVLHLSCSMFPNMVLKISQPNSSNSKSNNNNKPPHTSSETKNQKQCKWPISLSRCIVPYMRTRISINVNYIRIHDQGSFYVTFVWCQLSIF